MKLSKTSILYRSADFHSVTSGYEYSQNLCTFVSRYLFSLVFFTTLIYVAGFILTCILFFLIGYLSTGYWDSDSGFFSSGVVLVGIILIILTLAAVGYIIGALHRYAESRKTRPRAKKEPGIIATYLKARKEKYCPTLEFTE